MKIVRALIMAALTTGAVVRADAGQSFLVTDRYAGSIHRLEDINGDGDALDAGERYLWGTGLSNAAEMARYQSGVLVLDSVAARSFYFEDRNGDGDALDTGESVLWSDGMTNPFGIDVVADGTAYLSDYLTHQVFRARDVNQDGDALDAGERSLYAENILGAVSVLASDSEQFVVAFNSGRVHLLRDTNGDGDALDAGENVPHADAITWVEGITPRAGGGYYTGSWFYDTVYQVVDRNGDGDAFDVGEVLSYADNFFGGVSDPWGMTTAVNGDVLVANASGANVLTLRDKNHDGDALDIGEIVVFADGISAPVDIVALPTIMPGDFNADGKVDAADYVVWRKNGGTPQQFNLWRANFGNMAGSGAFADADVSVPEPAAAFSMLFGILATLAVDPRRMRQRLILHLNSI